MTSPSKDHEDSNKYESEIVASMDKMFLSAGHGLPFLRPGDGDLSAQLLPLLAAQETLDPAVLTTEEPFSIDLTTKKPVIIDLTEEDDNDATQLHESAPRASSRRVSRDSAVSLPRGRKQKAESTASPPKVCLISKLSSAQANQEQRRLSAHKVSTSPKPKKSSASQRLKQDIVERLDPASKDAIAQLHGLGNFVEEQVAGIVSFAQDVLRGQRDSTSLIDRLSLMEGAWMRSMTRSWRG